MALGFSSLTLFGRGTFVIFRCNSVSDKQFAVPARYVRELPEKLIERRVITKIFHTFSRYPSPVREPPVCDNVSSQHVAADYQFRAWATEQKAKRIHKSNEPSNKYDCFIHLFI